MPCVNATAASPSVPDQCYEHVHECFLAAGCVCLITTISSNASHKQSPLQMAWAASHEFSHQSSTFACMMSCPVLDSCCCCCRCRCCCCCRCRCCCRCCCCCRRCCCCYQAWSSRSASWPPRPIMLSSTSLLQQTHIMPTIG